MTIAENYITAVRFGDTPHDPVSQSVSHVSHISLLPSIINHQSRTNKYHTTSKPTRQKLEIAVEIEIEVETEPAAKLEMKI